MLVSLGQLLETQLKSIRRLRRKQKPLSELVLVRSALWALILGALSSASQAELYPVANRQSHYTVPSNELVFPLREHPQSFQ